jgi:hypothetical protein
MCTSFSVLSRLLIHVRVSGTETSHPVASIVDFSPRMHAFYWIDRESVVYTDFYKSRFRCTTLRTRTARPAIQPPASRRITDVYKRGRFPQSIKHRIVSSCNLSPIYSMQSLCRISARKKNKQNNVLLQQFPNVPLCIQLRHTTSYCNVSRNDTRILFPLFPVSQTRNKTSAARAGASRVSPASPVVDSAGNRLLHVHLAKTVSLPCCCRSSMVSELRFSAFTS